MFKSTWFKIFTIGLFFLICSALYIPEKEKETIDPWANPPMCSIAERFDIPELYGSSPLAPRLNTNWDHNFPISTTSKEAQAFFNQGLFFMYGFNHAEAERAFREAVRLDEDCAMAYWGVALALGPNINRAMQEEAFEDAYRYSQRALEFVEKVTPKERALIEALAIRYVENPPKNRSELDLKYANAMRLVAHRYREDVDILALFGESLMDTTPWDYWENPTTPKEVVKELHATLEYIIEKDPNHPGANHFYIHSVEEFQPQLAEGSADRLTASKYMSGHLVHMPSHIYIRLGRYKDANTANQGGISLDEDYITQCEAQGYYPALYYPHNLHFLWFGASMSGQKELAMEMARKTAEKGSIPRYDAVPLYAMLRFGVWEEILKEPKFKSEEEVHPYLELLWHYAQGMAHANLGNTDKAKAELETVKKLKKHEDLQFKANNNNAYRGMSEMCYLILAAEIAEHKKNYTAAVALLQSATRIQDAFSYREPPEFYMPMRQALGQALLKAGQAAEAEEVYREELAFFPDNGWSLIGLSQSLEAQGKKEEAKKVKAQFEKAWEKSDLEISASVL